MAKNNDPDFRSPSSSSIPTAHHPDEKPRKKRIKLSKLIEPGLVIPSNSTSTITRTKPKYDYGITKPEPSHSGPAPKIATRPCTECGKKFLSLKALFGHMRCHPERQWRGINPPTNHRGRPVLQIDYHHQQLSATASANVEDKMTEEEHEVASCLLMLANSDVSRATIPTLETISSSQAEDDEVDCRFECSSCKKVFGSHQALGGHRASHKNVKGCFAVSRTRITNDCEAVEDHSGSGEHGKENDGNSKMMMMMMVELGHKCEICLRVFSSGQALGGHKRCHWEKGEGASSSSSKNEGFRILAVKQDCGLDLNLPAPMEDESSSSYSSRLRPLTLDLSSNLK